MSGRNRQVVAIWAGAGIAVLVVVGVLLTTLGSGDGTSTTTSPTDAVGTTVPPVSAEVVTLFTEIPIPEGDYEAYCVEALEQGKDVTSTNPIDTLRAVAVDGDFDRLIPLAPEGLVEPLTRLRDERDAVLPVLEQVDSVSDLQPADLPENFLRDFGVVYRSTAQECSGLDVSGG